MVKTAQNKWISYLALSLNAIVLTFLIVYAFVRSGDVAANFFAVIMVMTFLFDMIYFTVSKSRKSIFCLIAIILLLTVNFIALFTVTLSIFKLSISVLGHTALIEIPILTILNVYDDIKKSQNTNNYSKNKSFKLIVTALFIILPIGIIFIAFCGLDLLFLKGATQINSNTTRVELMLIFGIIGLALLIFKLLQITGIREHLKKAAIVYIATIILVASIGSGSLLSSYTSLIDDIKVADKNFITAFGTTSLTKKSDKMRTIPYSLADEFFGIITPDYKIETDVTYYTATDKAENNLTLKYDMYYPTFDGACKSVIINLHGRGGDKDTGNYAHRNKYFASLGYVVYDLQYGDFNEKGTNFVMTEIDFDLLTFNHIAEFLKYAVTHNSVGANFDSLFITGVSLGGNIALNAATNNMIQFESIGVTLKGIVPVYPGFSLYSAAPYDYINKITKDTVPCLVIMGTTDGVVDPTSPFVIERKYREAENKNIATVWITNGGHGFDAMASARGNQILTYYMERFLEIHR